MAGCLVDARSHYVIRDGKSTRLEPRAMEVLVYLAERPGETISRAELEREVWLGQVVVYEALSNSISKLRKALGDDPKHHHIIETIPKAGYRLVGEVGHLQSRSPFHASIAVLPFTNMDGDAEQDSFADGMTDDLITDLSKDADLLVVARNSTFRYRKQPVDISRLSSELGVNFVLEGSVRRVGKGIRINAQLIEARSGGHIWAERYDHSTTDAIARLDQIARNVITALRAHLRP